MKFGFKHIIFVVTVLVCVVLLIFSYALSGIRRTELKNKLNEINDKQKDMIMTYSPESVKDDQTIAVGYGIDAENVKGGGYSKQYNSSFSGGFCNV